MGFDARLSQAWVDAFVPGSTSVARVRAYDETTPGDLTISDGTLTVYGEDGTQLVQVTSISGDGELSVAVLVPADTAPQRGRCVWALTPSSGTLPVYTFPCIIADVSLVPAMSTGDILEMHPELTDYPGNQTSWQVQLDRAWGELSFMLLGHADAPRLWSTNAWYPTYRLLALAHIHEAMSTYMPGGEYDRRARDYRREARDAWDALRLPIDTDGDGDLDGSSMAPVGASWPPALRRRS